MIEPGYLRIVVNKINKNSINPENPVSLPNGLQHLFETVFFSKQSVSKLNFLLEQLTFWALIKEPVSIKFVSNFFEMEENKIEDFIFEYSSWFNCIDSNKYLLYHDRLKIFILQRASQAIIIQINNKLLKFCNKHIKQKSNDEFEHYSLSNLSSHLFISSINKKEIGFELLEFAFNKVIWSRQFELSKSFDWTNKMMKNVFEWCVLFDKNKAIDTALNLLIANRYYNDFLIKKIFELGVLNVFNLEELTQLRLDAKDGFRNVCIQFLWLLENRESSKNIKIDMFLDTIMLNVEAKKNEQKFKFGIIRDNLIFSLNHFKSNHKIKKSNSAFKSKIENDYYFLKNRISKKISNYVIDVELKTNEIIDSVSDDIKKFNYENLLNSVNIFLNIVDFIGEDDTWGDFGACQRVNLANELIKEKKFVLAILVMRDEWDDGSGWNEDGLEDFINAVKKFDLRLIYLLNLKYPSDFRITIIVFKELLNEYPDLAKATLKRTLTFAKKDFISNRWFILKGLLTDKINNKTFAEELLKSDYIKKTSWFHNGKNLLRDMFDYYFSHHGIQEDLLLFCNDVTFKAERAYYCLENNIYNFNWNLELLWDVLMDREDGMKYRLIPKKYDLDKRDEKSNLIGWISDKKKEWYQNGLKNNQNKIKSPSTFNKIFSYNKNLNEVDFVNNLKHGNYESTNLIHVILSARNNLTFLDDILSYEYSKGNLDIRKHKSGIEYFEWIEHLI